MIRAGRLWWLMRRDWSRGFAATWHDYFLCNSVFRQPCLYRADDGEVAVHLLTGKDDWRLAAWMLKSWFHFTARPWKVWLHEDGTLCEEWRTRLCETFPGLRIVLRAEANERVERELQSFPLCREYRLRHPLSLKLFDIPAITPGERFIILDSDLLFFKKPIEILEWVEGAGEGCWFNADVEDALVVTPEEASGNLGVNLWPKVNSGLCLLHRDIFSWEFCEEVFSRIPVFQRTLWRVEQTLMALSASRSPRGGGLLPPKYEVSLNRWMRTDAVMRHYVGAVRDRFYGEGMGRLKRVLS